jgi:hypothetical protein
MDGRLCHGPLASLSISAQCRAQAIVDRRGAEFNPPNNMQMKMRSKTNYIKMHQNILDFVD